MKSSSKIIAGIVIILAVACFAYWTNKPVANTDTSPDAQQSDNTTSAPKESINPEGNTPSTSTSYKDGTYSVTEDYMSPGGKDSLGVSVTLKGGNISAVSVKNMAGDRTSSRYQDSFISSINSVVVGKPIDSLTIGVVSGASLASNAFNQALKDVKAQASK